MQPAISGAHPPLAIAQPVGFREDRVSVPLSDEQTHRFLEEIRVALSDGGLDWIREEADTVLSDAVRSGLTPANPDEHEVLRTLLETAHMYLIQVPRMEARAASLLTSVAKDQASQIRFESEDVPSLAPAIETLERSPDLGAITSLETLISDLLQELAPSVERDHGI